MATNAAAAYKDGKVLTATPAELTMMLYEGAIKFCNLALMAIEKKDYDKANQNIIKAEKIIIEFRQTLNMKYSVAQDFDVIYDYLFRRLLEANTRKDPEILEEILGYIREIRDTWKEVMRLAKGAQ